MSNGLAYPAPGTKVRVYTKDFALAWMNTYRKRYFEGLVKERRDKSAIVLYKPYGHDPYIEWDRVERIEFLDADGNVTGSTTPAEAQTEPASTNVKTWDVTGSKGKTYTVTQAGNQWTCTCVAGGFGRACKHVKEVKERETALLA